MKPNDNIGITYVNTVVGRGILNGVINLTLGALNFTPQEDGSIDPDQVITARLRMDVLCARQLHKALGDLLISIEQAENSPATVLDNNLPKSNEKPN